MDSMILEFFSNPNDLCFQVHQTRQKKGTEGKKQQENMKNCNYTTIAFLYIKCIGKHLTTELLTWLCQSFTSFTELLPMSSLYLTCLMKIFNIVPYIKWNETNRRLKSPTLSLREKEQHTKIFILLRFTGP